MELSILPDPQPRPVNDDGHEDETDGFLVLEDVGPDWFTVTSLIRNVNGATAYEGFHLVRKSRPEIMRRSHDRIRELLILQKALRAAGAKVSLHRDSGKGEQDPVPLDNPALHDDETGGFLVLEDVGPDWSTVTSLIRNVSGVTACEVFRLLRKSRPEIMRRSHDRTGELLILQEALRSAGAKVSLHRESGRSERGAAPKP